MLKIPLRSRRAEYESMSRGELIDALCALDREPSPENSRLLHELEVHQVELEAQNRQLLEQQEELEEARNRYFDLFEGAPVAYCVLDRNGVIEDANGATATLIRTSRAALVGIPFARAVSVVEKQTFVDHIARCLDEQVRVTSELAVVVRGRGEIALQIVSTPLGRSGARATSCRTMLHDVTRLKRSEGVLRFVAGVDESLAGAETTESALETMVHACVPTVADACFLDVCGEEDTPLRRVQIFAPGQDAVVEQLKRHANDGAWRRYEMQLVRTLTPVFEPASAAALGAGYETKVGARALMLLPLAARGKKLGVIGMMMTQSSRTHSLHDFELAQDLARRFAMKLANALAFEQAQAAVRARDEILEVVSQNLGHEIATASGADALGDGSVRRIQRIVRNLVDVARIDGGRLAMERRSQDMSELVARAIGELERLAHERSVTVEHARLPGLLASCDPARIAQVLEMLLDAAIRATPAGGTVSVRVDRVGTVIRTSVSDAGPPIDDELLPWAFDPAWQNRVRGSARAEVGLGFYVAKGVVEAQGGTVSAASDASGATFSFTLPADGARRSESTAPLPRPSQPRPAIFLADADE
ncbi:MAG TPA: ATP-binding protein [Polyangiaceae bacterium]|jgi:PAS domain S-box-containing protein